MNIGIIGAGNVSTRLARILVARGTASFSASRRMTRNSPPPRTHLADAATVPEAIAFGDLVVLATPWGVTAEALQQAGPVTEKKFLGLHQCPAARHERAHEGTTTSAGEEVARLAPWARVVKAIPPFAEMMHAPGAGRRATDRVFICGDDADAKSVVQELLADLDAAPTDAGPLRNARYAEPRVS